MDTISLLILEDDPAHAEAIRRAFESSGQPAEIRVASSLREYCEMVDARPPHIALLDLNLPDGDTDEALSLLSVDGPFPALVMTSMGNEKVAVAAMKAGALDYLVKSPEAFNDMPRSVQRVLREWNLLQEKRRVEEKLAAAEKIAREKSALLESILDSPQGVVVFALDSDCRYTEFTRAHRDTMKAIWGVDIEIGMSILDAIGNPDDRERAQRHFDSALQGESLLVEEEYGDESLRRTFYENRYSPLCDASGKVIGVAVMVIDITQRKRAEAELLNLRAAVEQSANTIIITGTNGVIEYANPAFQKNTGYSADEVLGRTPRVLKSGEQDRDYYRNLWETISSGKTWSGQLHNRRKDGSLCWVSATISPVFDERGGIIRYIGVQEDINELKGMESSLREALDRAEEATLAKSEFLANMSHEIRTPINGIMGMADLLLDTGQTAEQREYAEAIRACGGSLLSLINDILDFSKVEAGQLLLESLDFDIRTTVEESLEILAVKAQQKDLDVVCMISEDVPEILRGDPGRLRQILFNLVGNAIKFTSSGGVTVRADLQNETETTVTLRLSVADTGIGIPRDKQEAVFAKFIQADLSTSRQFGGTGLGLAICRQLIHLLQGEISVTSEEGMGSTFSFTAVFQKPPTGAIQPTPKEADLSGVKVLVTDDFETNRVLMTNLLQRWGCRFAEASDGASAIALLKQAAREQDPFAAAFLDMQMPGLDGAELGRQIKGDDEIKSTRLVMLTSLGRRGDAERLAGVGFSGYLPKPIRPALLRKCLALVLGRQEAEDGSDRDLVTRHTVAETARRRLRVLVAEDNTTSQTIAVKMLEKLGHMAEAVANGEEVIDSLRRIPYDLVLMDCQMPVVDGFAATRIIRDPGSNVLNPRVPIIALTAHAMKRDRDLCIEVGMNDYVSKPTSLHDLAAAIERSLAGVSGFDHAARVADAGSASRDFDREGFIERTLGDPGLAREVAAAFLADSPTLFERLSRAISAGDAVAAGKFAHELKGSSATMGGQVLSEIAAEMQEAGTENNLPRLAELLSAARPAFLSLCARLQEFGSPDKQG